MPHESRSLGTLPRTAIRCLAISVCLTACASEPKLLQVSPPLVEPLVEQADAVIVVSYDEDLLHHSCINGPQLSVPPPAPKPASKPQQWRFALGDASVAMFDDLLPKLFSDVRLANTQSLPVGRDYTTINIALDHYSACNAANTGEISIGYELIVNPAGSDREIAWRGAGTANVTEYQYDPWLELREWKFASEQFLEQLTVAAMRYALADLVVNLQDDPELSEWRTSLPVMDEPTGY
ncbi:MAG: hypothetical protein R3192_03850 [Woeseiaceae bacterium]|nr:hypothetical protein [Woeseiaceae bacterium]